jgi:homoserine kinase
MLRFRVPASTTNLGHGFDCLGIALAAVNLISVEPASNAAVVAPGAPDDGLARMASTVRDACAKRWNTALPGFIVRVSGEVPVARGMGSSSTIFLGVAAACQQLANRPFAKQELLEIAAAEEGHPDNAAAACMGGFTIVAATPHGLRWSRFAVPRDLVAVVAIPPFEVKTSEARRILPQQVDRADLVRGVQRSALITALLASGRISELTGLFDDAWHEQYRATVNPGLIEARAAAHHAGAIGTILSGSGSTVLSFSERRHAPAVAEAVLSSYRTRGVAAEVRTLEFDNDGLAAV